MYKIYAGMSQRPRSLQRNPRALLNMKITKAGCPERTSGIKCGSGFQPRQLNSRLEAAPTESLSNGNLDFPDKQVTKYLK